MTASAHGSSRPGRQWLSALLVWLTGVCAGPALAGPNLPAGVHKVVASMAAPAATPRPSPEQRLIEIYRQVGAAQTREALAKAEALVRDVPNFQLAQLVYADLLLARSAPLPGFGAGGSGLAPGANEQLALLRQEASLRLQGLRESPPQGAIPRQFVELPTSTRHAIAVDASRARLYLFERTANGLELVGSRYVSLGRSGIGKAAEGDQRTPLGVYFITSRLDDHQVTDFYGPGALPLNYPNEYDRRLGRTGSGIWLHGVPRESYARSPLATDGCVVMSNDDLTDLLKRVQPRTTPVVIAQKLDWVMPDPADPERRAVLALLESWRLALSSADANRLASFYSPQFVSGTTSFAAWRKQLEQKLAAQGERETALKELSVLAWRDESEILVVTFGEVARGARGGPLKRQYWGKEGGQWKIFFEGVIG